jgi:hypothetical protein
LGYFVARWDGLSLTADDVDELTVRHAPQTKTAPVRVVVQGVSPRLDPAIGVTLDETGITACADWGLRPCALDGWREAEMIYNGVAVRFDRLSAVADLLTGDVAPILVQVGAGNPAVVGEYTVWVLGGMSKE